MSREEDLIRSTTRAIASGVREVPPLRLGLAADELGARAVAPLRPHGGRPRRWRSWGAPLAAAALVVALALVLALVRNVPNGRTTPAPATSAGGADSVPRYYVALKQLAGGVSSNAQRSDIVVGDSLTGKTLGTLAPPARTAFESVTAAADDRTFVVFGLTSSTGSFQPGKGAMVTGSWYGVRVSPGAGDPVSLTRLPITPQTVPGSYKGAPVDAFTDSFNTALSESGQELAVPEWTGPGRLTVKVFSVATGQLLHAWTTDDPSLTQGPALAWLDGDKELALVSRSTTMPPKATFAVRSTTVREWPVAGPASGDLLADSTVAWDLQTGNGSSSVASTPLQSCVGPVVGGSVLISADGKTFTCTTGDVNAGQDVLRFLSYPLAAGTTATTPYTASHQFTFTKAQGIYVPKVLWTSSSGGTLIGALFPDDGSAAAVARGLSVWLMTSRGTFTRLRVPASLSSAIGAIAF